MFMVRITEPAGGIHDQRYRFIWTAWLDGVLLGSGHANHPDEALSKAQELVHAEDFDDLLVDCRGRSVQWQ
jgi:hypothetical protein